MPDQTLPVAAAVVERRIRLAAFLVCLGLFVFLITLFRVHPLAFVAFAVIGCPLVITGIAVFLYSIVSYEPKTRTTL
jgi:uncharacterized membrane protein